MFKTIQKWLSGPASAVTRTTSTLEREGRLSAGTAARHWEAAETTEENQHQWLFADGRSINEILVDQWERITQRATLEARRNPTVEGVIRSHACDVVGDEGPSLQMMTDDDAWNDQAEAVWREVAESIDGSGRLSLGEWLRQDVYQSWTTGDMIAQIVDDSLADTAVHVRVHPISPLRLRSPYPGQHSGDLLLGIERNKMNRPQRYFFIEEVRSEFGYAGTKHTAVDARNILHWFESIEPGQVRGFPRLASCLQAISDLREFDHAVLDAAKVAAMMAVLMFTKDDMAEADPNPADVQLKRMGITRLPVGWQAQGLNPTQPAANNTEFRNERSRELGRPVGMPLMQVRLDSSGHNYSSARFDAQNYQKANRVIQGSLGRHRVYPVVRLVLNEAMRRNILAPMVFDRRQVAFRWPQPPHVDPVKEAMAERIRLENRTISPQDACSAHNLDFEKVARQWAKANSILEANGMPPLLGSLPTDLAELAAYLNGAEENEADEDRQNVTTAA